VFVRGRMPIVRRTETMAKEVALKILDSLQHA